MKTKNQRLLAIRKLIENQKISSQEELVSKLSKKGFNLTQATLSRDLKYLRAAKIADAARGYIYFLPSRETEQASLLSDEKFPHNGFVSIEFAWHMGVIRTLPGYAPSIASAIDNIGSYEIMGTIAGDDTILVIPREGATKEDVKKIISRLIHEAVK